MSKAFVARTSPQTAVKLKALLLTHRLRLREKTEKAERKRREAKGKKRRERRDREKERVKRWRRSCD